MSSRQSNFSASTSFSFSSSSSSSSGQQSGQRYMQQTHSDNNGTTFRSASQKLGEPVVTESRKYDAQGRELLEGGAGAPDSSRRIEDVSDEEQAKRDREYEEKIEDEYAKREGGA